MVETISNVMSNNNPQPISLFSDYGRAGNIVWITGKVPIHKEINEKNLGTFAEQTELILQTLQSKLSKAGISFIHVIQSRVFITKMDYYKEVNQVYRSFFGNDMPVCIETSCLAEGADVEIDLIAWV